MIGYKKREYCAGCDGSDFLNVLSLGEVPLAGVFPLKEELENESKYPLNLLFCKKNNIPCTKIFRCAVQVTFNYGDNNKAITHIDHPWDHNQFILYLNDTTGDTVIMDKSNKNPEKIVEPKKYRGLVFDKRYHYYYFPSTNTRNIVFFTKC